MSKVLVVYYSAFGYVAIVANAIAEGARQQGRLIAQTADKLSGRGGSGAADLKPSAALEAATP